MKIGLDTSVILRLLIGEPAAQAERAWRALTEARAAGDATVLSDLVVSETYFALQHHYRVPKAEALEQLRALGLIRAACPPPVTLATFCPRPVWPPPTRALWIG